MSCYPKDPNWKPPYTRDDVFDNYMELPGHIRSYKLLDAMTAKMPWDVPVGYEKTYGAYVGIEHLLLGVDTPQAKEAKHKAKEWARLQEPVPLKPR